jgi:hypothetical protein
MINPVENPSNLSELFRVRLDNKSDSRECSNHIMAIEVAPPHFAAFRGPTHTLRLGAQRFADSSEPVFNRDRQLSFPLSRWTITSVMIVSSSLSSSPRE